MKYIDVKKEGHICWVYLDREEAMNALSTDVLKEITEVNLGLNEDLESRVVIYAGKGDHFSAGADLKETKRIIEKSTATKKDTPPNVGMGVKWTFLSEGWSNNFFASAIVETCINVFTSFFKISITCCLPLTTIIAKCLSMSSIFQSSFSRTIDSSSNIGIPRGLK